MPMTLRCYPILLVTCRRKLTGLTDYLNLTWGQTDRNGGDLLITWQLVVKGLIMI